MKHTKQFLLSLSGIMLALGALCQPAAPIQHDTVEYNGNLYHNQSIGINIKEPKARLHIHGGNYVLPAPGIMQVYRDLELFKVTTRVISSAPFYGPRLRTYFVVAQTGNVGIGVDRPAEKLHVMGNIRGGEQAGELRLQTDHGYLQVGAADANSMHFYTDRSSFYFDKRLTVDEGIIGSYDEDLMLQTNGTSRLLIKENTGDVHLLGGRLIIENSAGMGIGTNQIALNADGTIRAREILVDLQQIPDYVFDESYPLMPLDELKQYISVHKHLPKIKSEAAFKKEGHYTLGEMNVRLLEKVEEIILYLIELEERIDLLETNNH